MKLGQRFGIAAAAIGSLLCSQRADALPLYSLAPEYSRVAPRPVERLHTQFTDPLKMGRENAGFGGEGFAFLGNSLSLLGNVNVDSAVQARRTYSRITSLPATQEVAGVDVLGLVIGRSFRVSKEVDFTILSGTNFVVATVARSTLSLAAAGSPLARQGAMLTFSSNF